MSDESQSSGLIGRIWKALAFGILFEAASLLFLLDIEFRPIGIILITPSGLNGFFHKLLEGIAIAILIAVIIKEMIEREYDDRQSKEMMAAANISRTGVLKTLFSTFFDEETVAEVNRSIFSSTLFREDAVVTYRLSPHPTSSWLVQLHVTIEYSITNAAITPAPFPIVLEAANYAAIFREDAGLAAPTLESARIGNESLSEAEIAAVNAKVDRHTNPSRFELGARTLAAGHSLQLCASYVRDKLICDMELMTMSYPTKRVTLRIRNDCAPAVEVNLRSIGPLGFAVPPNKATASTWDCTSQGILLQNNGWALYWNDPLLKPSRIPGERLPPGKGAGADATRPTA
jgi:hypothetical protein